MTLVSPKIAAPAPDRPAAGILLVILGMLAISINDMIIKGLSGGYPLHQITFTRSLIAIWVPIIILARSGGFAGFSRNRLGLQILRGLLIVGANLCFFAGLAMLSLAEATALFFVAPLVVTLLSWPVLGERVGPRRIAAVIVGFIGVLVMLQPWSNASTDVPLWVRGLPVLGALSYSAFLMLTRHLGTSSSAAMMAIYVQLSFIAVSAVVFVVAGDGGFAEGQTNPTLQFLLRAWHWPGPQDLLLFFAIGGLSAVLTLAMSQAYKIAPPATVAPFEYVGLPLAMLWGWVIWGTIPTANVWAGSALIVGSGLFVLWRSQQVTES